MNRKTNTAAEQAFFEAVKHGKSDVVRTLVAGDSGLLAARDYGAFGGTPLNLVVFKRDMEMINTLLDLGANPDDWSDWEAGPWNAIQSALNAGHDDLATMFAERGANIGVHEAAGLNRIDRLKELLEQDTRLVDSRGGDGCTPLHFAGSSAVVDILLAKGAAIDARDIDHYSTPAQYLAKNRPEVTRYLFERGATPDIFSAVVAADEVRVRQMISDDPTVLHRRIDRTTFPPGSDEVDNILTFTIGGNASPLHAAAVAGHVSMMELLVIEHNMDPNTRGAYDESTALHSAAWNDDLSIARWLVENGADINAYSGEIHNNTPAGWAIVAGSANVFCYLMDQGALALDFFRGDAEAAVEGAFRQFKCVPQENYERILKRLS